MYFLECLKCVDAIEMLICEWIDKKNVMIDMVWSAA